MLESGKYALGRFSKIEKEQPLFRLNFERMIDSELDHYKLFRKVK